MRKQTTGISDNSLQVCHFKLTVTLYMAILLSVRIKCLQAQL